jgi:hypothetical protein
MSCCERRYSPVSMTEDENEKAKVDAHRRVSSSVSRVCHETREVSLKCTSQAVETSHIASSYQKPDAALARGPGPPLPFIS